MLRVPLMLVALLIQSAAARHIMMLPVPPTTTLPIRALLQTGIKAVDNDTIAVLRAANVTKPAGLMTLNNMTGSPQTQAQAAPPQSSPIVVKSGPAQPPVPVSVSGNGKIGPLTFGALAGIATAVVVAALGMCVALSCWCHRRRGVKVVDTSDAKGVDSNIPEAATVCEDSSKADVQLAPPAQGQQGK